MIQQLPPEIIQEVAKYAGSLDPHAIINLMKTCQYLYHALVDTQLHYSGLCTRLFPLQDPNLDARPSSLVLSKYCVEEKFRKNRVFRQVFQESPTPPNLQPPLTPIIHHMDEFLPATVVVRPLFQDKDATPLNRWVVDGLRLRWCKTVGVFEHQAHVVFSVDLVSGAVQLENVIPARTLLRLPHVLQKTEFFHMNPEQDFLASSRQAPVLVFDISRQRLSYHLTTRDGTPVSLRRVGRGKIADIRLPLGLSGMDNLRVVQLCDRFSLVRVWRYQMEMLLLCDYDQLTCRNITGGPVGHVTCVAVVNGLLWLTVTRSDEEQSGDPVTVIQEWFIETKDATAIHIRDICLEETPHELFAHAASDIITGRYVKTRTRLLDTENLTTMTFNPTSVFCVIQGIVHCFSFSQAWLDDKEVQIGAIIGNGLWGDVPIPAIAIGESNGVLNSASQLGIPQVIS